MFILSNQQLSPQSQQLLNQPARIPLFINSQHSLNDGGHQPKRQPLLKIPSPEEIENAVSLHNIVHLMEIWLFSRFRLMENYC